MKGQHFWVEFQPPAGSWRLDESSVCFVGVAGWVGRNTGLASSAERREDILLSPQFLLMLLHSQAPDSLGGPS